MNSRLIIAAGNINNSPVLLKRFRGKTAKELYRFGKGIALTGSISKLLRFAAAQIPGEFTRGIVYTAVGQIGESILSYLSGVGF